MAKHKFLSVTDGGYFYRFYPKITKHPEPLRDPLKRLLLFAPPNEVGRVNHLHSLYGKFLCKYHDKELIVELEQSGEIIITDYYTEQTEIRTLSSIPLIQVPEHIYAYPFKDHCIYSLTVTEVTLIKQL